jgi:LysR family positive regulator for ilvC
VELLDYRLFCHLCQTMHFGRTARGLGMSPSALTRRVQAMEEEIGQQLLIRDHREVRLTGAGKRFRSFAQAHLDQWEQLRNELREEAAAPTGTLSLACTVTAAHTVLPRLLTKFRTLYPGVTLGLITQDATRSLNQLEAGEVDLAVIPTDDEPPASLSRVVLGRTELSFICPLEMGDREKSLKKRTANLSDVPLIATIAGLERKRLNEWLNAHQLDPPIVA